MDRLYFKFIALHVGSSLVAILLLRAITGEFDAAVMYASTVASAIGAGKWYASAAVAASSNAQGTS